MCRSENRFITTPSIPQNVPIQPPPNPATTGASTIRFEAENIHIIEEAVQLELAYRRDLYEQGMEDGQSVAALEQLTSRLDSLKDQFEAPFEFEPIDVTEPYGLAMSLCRTRFVLEYPPEDWDTDLLARFASNAKSRIRDVGFTISDIDAALEPINQTVSWADDLAEFFFYIKPSSAAPEDKYLEEIARQGEKEHVLREIEARRDPNSSLSVYEVPEYYNVEGEDIEEQAAAFIDSWNETRTNLSEPVLERLLMEWEESWGLIADEYISRAQL